MKMKKWSSQWTQFMQLRKEAWKKIQDFNGVWTRDLAITCAMLYQLSYEATKRCSPHTHDKTQASHATWKWSTLKMISHAFFDYFSKFQRFRNDHRIG